jgi:glycosyltransferase involved in cell wall biosynthesis
MTLVEALPHLPPSLAWRLRVFGDGYLRQAVEARIEALGLSDRVVFEGFTQDWHTALFDAFVFPTRYEGMSNALLEAAAAGMPIVASAIPENLVVLEDGTHALLAPAGDSHAFARAMTRIATTPGLDESLGARAREHARRFSFDTMVRAHEELYARLVNVRRSRHAA